MSPEREDPTEEREELYEEVPPRSIFAATWFRVVLVVIVLGVIGAVAVPYVLDWMNPPAPARTASSKTPAPAAPTPSTTPAPPAEKKDTPTLIPAPTPPPAETKPAPPPAKPAPSVAAKATEAPKPAAKPAPAPEAKPAPKTATPPKSATESKSTTTAAADKPPAATKSAGPTTAAATKPTAPARTTAKAATPAASATGSYWVQVGAFKDAETAKKIAAKLREDKYNVEESVKRAPSNATPAPAASAPAATQAGPSPTDQYDVFVTGMSAADLNAKLAAKGLAAEPSGAGMIVKPSLPLRDAVALSKDLAVEGFKVQVRRSGSAAAGPTPAAPAAPVPPAPRGGDELHRVRVGAFPDRAAAQAVARELEGKGYKPFIARGDQ